MFAHVASAPQNSATSNSELPFAAFRVPTIRPPPHNCGRGSMPAFRHVTQPREGEVATPHIPSTCTGNNQCLYPFPVALRLPQIETTIFAVSALYNETVSGPFREHRAYPSAVMHHSCEFEYSVDKLDTSCLRHLEHLWWWTMIFACLDTILELFPTG